MDSPSAELPEFLTAFFWDTDPAAIDPVGHRDFVIGRILSVGTLDALRWARAEFGDDAIREWIVRHDGRQLSGPQLRFWETVIGLPGDKVNDWLARPERRIWEGRAGS
ncbi:MAG: DUF6922 domain-containing protein [Planctomycetia bacterium]|jgi:hypothetical protein